MLHRGHRHDALVGVAEVRPRLLRLHGPGLEQKNAGDDLKTVGNAVLHLLEQNFLCLKQFVLFAISLTTSRHVLYRQKNGRGRTIFVKHSASIDQHHASADRGEFVLDLIGLDRAALRNNVFEDCPEFRDVPLPVAQLEEQPALRLPGGHRESAIKRAARSNHAQVQIEHEKRLAYGVDDGLSQAMPMRDSD